MKVAVTRNAIQESIRYFFESDSRSMSAARFILGMAAMGGVIFVGAAAPGILKMAKTIGFSKKYSERQLRDAFSNLKRRKLIRIIEDGNGKSKAELTINGLKKVKEFSLDGLKIDISGKWDRRWRILIFDIPTSKSFNRARDALRSKIKELGFYQLQRSVWIYPFPCEEEILFVSEMYNIEKYIEILTVEKLLHENQLLQQFKGIIEKNKK